MLPRNMRLSPKQITEVQKQGYSARTQYLKIKWFSNGTGPARLAIIVPVKISKKAVLRNRYKRCIRASLMKHRNNLRHNLKAVITVLSPFSNISQPDADNKLREVLATAGLQQSA